MPQVFISYSRTDESRAKLIRNTLEAMSAGSTFMDRNDLKPGQKWREQLEEAILGCEKFILFWCAHSASSDEVRKEYERALQLDKTMVPYRLDQTDLPESLCEWQWIDAQDVGCGSLPRGRPKSNVDPVAPPKIVFEIPGSGAGGLQVEPANDPSMALSVFKLAQRLAE